MKNVLKSKSGEGQITTAMIIIIAVVVGAVILGGLYAVYENIIIPKTTDGVEEMIYTGAQVQVRITTNSVQYSYDGENWEVGSVPGLDGSGTVTGLLSIGSEDSIVWLMSYKTCTRAYACSSQDGINWTPIYADTTSITITKSGSYIYVFCGDGRSYRTTDGISWIMTSTRRY